MAEVIGEYGFSAMNDAAAANEKVPLAATQNEIIRHLNHLAARHTQVLFCQHVRDGMMASPTGNLTPIYRYRWYDSWDHRRVFSHRVIAMKTATAAPANLPRYRPKTGSTASQIDIYAEAIAPAERVDTTYGATVSSNVISGTFDTQGVDSHNDLRPIAVAIVARRWEDPTTPMVLTADEGALPTTTYGSQSVVEDANLLALRNAIDAHWLGNRRQFAAWSSIGTTGVSGGNVITTTSATFINLMDVGQALAARTATTPGLICPIQFCGRMRTTTVESRCAVYAYVDDGAGGAPAGTGVVRFESSQNAVQIVNIGAAPALWYASNDDLLLGSTAADEYDKVDVFGRVTNVGDRLIVYAWSLCEVPV